MEMDKIFFTPGNIVRLKHNVDNRPKMLVVEKKTRTLRSSNDVDSVQFLGILCR